MYDGWAGWSGAVVARSLGSVVTGLDDWCLLGTGRVGWDVMRVGWAASWSILGTFLGKCPIFVRTAGTSCLFFYM